MSTHGLAVPNCTLNFFKADNVGNGSKCLSTKGVLLIELKKKIQGMAGDDCRCPLREGIRCARAEWPLIQTYAPGSQLVRMSENKYKCSKNKTKTAGKERGGKEGPVSVLARFLFTFSFPSSRVTESWKRLGIHLQSNVNITSFFCCHIRTRTLQIRLSFIML